MSAGWLEHKKSEGKKAAVMLPGAPRGMKVDELPSPLGERACPVK